MSALCMNRARDEARLSLAESRWSLAALSSGERYPGASAKDAVGVKILDTFSEEIPPNTTTRCRAVSYTAVLRLRGTGPSAPAFPSMPPRPIVQGLRQPSGTVKRGAL